MTIQTHLLEICQTIRDAEYLYHRPSNCVSLIVASKNRTTDDIRNAFEAGQQDFGENYLQEAIEKQKALNDLPITWHFIGTLQSNKASRIAQHFDWVHTVSNLKQARALNAGRTNTLPLLNICIQLNLTGENTKSGISPSEVRPLAEALKLYPHLRLRGLMTLPAPEDQFDHQRKPFRALHDIFVELNQTGFTLDTLSMGMSNDYLAAIAEGATMVRIGTALFGPRSQT